MSTSVRFGSVVGELLWHVEASSFGVRLGFGGPADAERPLVVGGEPGRFITVDALLNHLWLLGLVPDRESADEVTGFRERVARTFGEVELAGVSTPAGRELLIVCPDARVIPVRPPLDHGPHPFGWGSARSSDHCGGGPVGLPSVDEATMATARELIRRSCGRGWGPGEELAAEALAHNHLDRCGPTFSFSANSISDWYLFDCEPTTGLTAVTLSALSLRPMCRRPVWRRGHREAM